MWCCLLLTVYMTINLNAVRQWIKFTDNTTVRYRTKTFQTQTQKVLKAKEIKVRSLNIKYQPPEQVAKRQKRDAQAYDNLEYTLKPELRYEYGMLFSHQGALLAGLQKMYLFLAVDLPTVADLKHEPPKFPDCSKWAPPTQRYTAASQRSPGMYTHEMYQNQYKDDYSHLTTPIHHQVCEQYKMAYTQLLNKISDLKRNITYKIEEEIPRLLPNERVFKNTDSLLSTNRTKRAIPIGAIISGISAIGGLLTKGISTFANYKKSKAMAKAMRVLNEQNNMLHNRLI